MDNEGGAAAQPGSDINVNQDPNIDQLGAPGAGGDENVDQYFDDGGETFLPADHVSDLQNWDYGHCLS